MEIVKMSHSLGVMTETYFKEWMEIYHLIEGRLPGMILHERGLRSLTPELWEAQFEFVLPLTDFSVLYRDICDRKESGLWTIGNFWTIKDMRRFAKMIVKS